jgi:mono/diheme cytochrome c family protein
LLIDAGKTDDEADKEIKLVQATRDQRPAPSSGSLLAKVPAAYDRLADPYDDSADLAARARSYLHVNCASCHMSAGGGNAQIELLYTTSLKKLNAIDTPPLHNALGVERPQIIAAGDPQRSILLHRTALRGRGQMPPLATSLVDTRAVDMLRRWIETLEPLPVEEEKE